MTEEQAVQEVRKRLFALQDPGYRDFHSKLMPTVAREKVIGVRVPALRKLAKELAAAPQTPQFLAMLPHDYYEENNLHGFLLCQEKDYAACVQALDRFLPYVDNWATCDLLSPPVFRQHRPLLLQDIRRWMSSPHTYMVRFGAKMLMDHFLDEDFDPQYLQWAAKMPTEEYYLHMMCAWYFATALTKQYAAALPYLQEGRLDRRTHNKTIQKAVESYRIPPEHKAALRALRR